MQISNNQMFAHHYADPSLLPEKPAVFQWTAQSQNRSVSPAPGPTLFPHAALDTLDGMVPSYFTLLIFHVVRLSSTTLAGKCSVSPLSKFSVLRMGL